MNYSFLRKWVSSQMQGIEKENLSPKYALPTVRFIFVGIASPDSIPGKVNMEETLGISLPSGWKNGLKQVF
jgi:hypothetical protein